MGSGLLACGMRQSRRRQARGERGRGKSAGHDRAPMQIVRVRPRALDSRAGRPREIGRRRLAFTEWVGIACLFVFSAQAEKRENDMITTIKNRSDRRGRSWPPPGSEHLKRAKRDFKRVGGLRVPPALKNCSMIGRCRFGAPRERAHAEHALRNSRRSRAGSRP
jgi:hypothetical protein